MKIAISVGEHSADIHGANLVREIKKINPNTEFFGFGGRLMKSSGVDLEYDLTEMAIIGFIEPIKKYFFLKKLLYKFVERIKTEKPDLLILIDYPGFNLLLAKEVHKLNIPIIYYIAPQVWAWGKKRIKKIKKYIKKVIVILPFEEDIYKNAGIDVVFVGHPIIDIVKPNMAKEEMLKKLKLNPDIKTIGIFPGSRKQEVSQLLTDMLEVVVGIKKKIENIQFVLALSPTVEINIELLNRFFNSCCAKPEVIKISLEGDILHGIYTEQSECVQNNDEFNIKIVRDEQYDVMNISDLIIAASGTVVLEASIMEKPVIVMYKLNKLSYNIAKFLIKVKYISLVNIIENKEVIPEYIQNFNINDIINKSIDLLENKDLIEKTKTDLKKVSGKLGKQGVSKRVASEILTNSL